jgi:hypothetical protein
MNAEQEIRAEAVKAALLTLSVMEPEKRYKVLDHNGRDMQENVISISLAYEHYIRTGSAKST